MSKANSEKKIKPYPRAQIQNWENAQRVNEVLRENDEPLSRDEIVLESVYLSKKQVMRALQTLKENHAVEKIEDPNDGRRVLYRLRGPYAQSTEPTLVEDGD